jgi:hypothetical protein
MTQTSSLPFLVEYNFIVRLSTFFPLHFKFATVFTFILNLNINSTPTFFFLFSISLFTLVPQLFRTILPLFLLCIWTIFISSFLLLFSNFDSQSHIVVCISLPLPFPDPGLPFAQAHARTTIIFGLSSSYCVVTSHNLKSMNWKFKGSVFGSHRQQCSSAKDCSWIINT